MKIIYDNPKLISYSYSDENTQNRILSYFSNYSCSTIYAVTRCEIWKKDLAKICKLKVSSPYVYERLIELSNVSSGKIFIHDELSWVRNGMVEPNIPQRSIFLRNWLNNKKFILEHIEVKNVLKKILVDQKYSNYIFEKIFVAKKIKIRQKIRIILREIRFM